MTPGSVAAIVVNYRTPALALECVAALLDDPKAPPGLVVILVDGGSADGSVEHLAAALPHAPWADRVTLLPLPVNGGFGYANNQAMLHVDRTMPDVEHVFLCNPDARPRLGALAMLTALMDRQRRAGAVGAQLEEEDGTAQGSAFTFPSITGEFSRGANTDVLRRLLRVPATVLTPPVAAQVPWVTGAAVLLRMAALREVGLFDDGFFLYFEEVDLMRRLDRAGWQVWHEPAARVVHEGGGSTDVKWGEEGFHKPMALPRYWYRSRRRYFVRAGSPAQAGGATAAFIAGRLIWLFRMAVQRRRDRFPLHTLRDTLRHSLWPVAADRRCRLPRLGDAPNARPAWMGDDDD